MPAPGARWFTELFGSHIGEEELNLREKLKGEIATLLAAPLMPGMDLTVKERKEVRRHIKAKGRWHGGRYLGEA